MLPGEAPRARETFLPAASPGGRPKSRGANGMATARFRPLLLTMALALGGAGLAAAAAAPAAAVVKWGAGDCVARHPSIFGEDQAQYTAGGSGEDEPERDPGSSMPGAARKRTCPTGLP